MKLFADHQCPFGPTPALPQEQKVVNHVLSLLSKRGGVQTLFWGVELVQVGGACHAFGVSGLDRINICVQELERRASKSGEQ